MPLYLCTMSKYKGSGLFRLENCPKMFSKRSKSILDVFWGGKMLLSPCRTSRFC